MQNIRLNVKASGVSVVTNEQQTTAWEFVCEGARVGNMMASAIEKMEDEYGEGIVVTITAQATSDAVDI